MASIFSRIVAGDIPCYKLAEDERFLAFLDLNPIAKGHSLVIPKVEVDYIFDLDARMLGDLHIFSQKVAKGIGSVVVCKRVGVAVVGLEVPHAHIHLIPINSTADISFARPVLQFSAEEFTILARDISKVISL